MCCGEDILIASCRCRREERSEYRGKVGENVKHIHSRVAMYKKPMYKVQRTHTTIILMLILFLVFPRVNIYRLSNPPPTHSSQNAKQITPAKQTLVADPSHNICVGKELLGCGEGYVLQDRDGERHGCVRPDVHHGQPGAVDGMVCVRRQHRRRAIRPGAMHRGYEPCSCSVVDSFITDLGHYRVVPFLFFSGQGL